MVEIVVGDLLETKEDIIGHQVNCKGVMGSGVAKQIKVKYYAAFEAYDQMVMRVMPKYLLGRCQMVYTIENKYVANLFGQFDYGLSKRHTDYDALKNALKELNWFAEGNGLSVALPYKIGCDRGGGDWEIVSKMIEDIFQNVKVKLYKLK